MALHQPRIIDATPRWDWRAAKNSRAWFCIGSL
jgi:hypothetical protein